MQRPQGWADPPGCRPSLSWADPPGVGQNPPGWADPPSPRCRPPSELGRPSWMQRSLGLGRPSPRYGQQAGGTHPTGMHICFISWVH